MTAVGTGGAAAAPSADRRSLLHFAAECHRRKWEFEHSDPRAFDVLHRLGEEMRAALAAAAGRGGAA